MNGRPWSEKDMQYLENAAAKNVAHSQMAKHLKRTRSAVKNKLFEMRLCNSNAYMSVQEVASALDVHPHTIVKQWIEKHNFPARKTHYSYCIDYDDLMKWLSEHQQLWSAKHLELYVLGTEPEWLTHKRRNEQLPKGGTPWPEDEKRKAIEMYRRGATNQEIGDAFGRTAESARRLLYRVGVYGGKRQKEII